MSAVSLLVVSCSGPDEFGLSKTPLDDPSEPVVLDSAAHPDATSDQQSCGLPIRENLAASYVFGVPSGWIVDDDGAILAVMEDERATTAAFVYTALLRHPVRPVAILEEIVDIFATSLAFDGGVMAWEVYEDDDDYAFAPVDVELPNDTLVGGFEVVRDGDFATFYGHWAPANLYVEAAPVLGNVLSCFERTTVLTDAHLAAAAARQQEAAPVEGATLWGPLVDQRDGDFTFRAPTSWASHSEFSPGDSPTTSLQLTAPQDDAAVVFVFNLGRFSVVNPADIVSALMASYGIQAGLSDHTTVGDVNAYLFDGTLEGRAVRGSAVVRIEPYQTFFANYLGIQIAEAASWSRYASTLNAMQESILMTDASGSLASLPPNPSFSTESVFGAIGSPSSNSSYHFQQEASDRMHEEWAAGMRGYETAVSPSTGEPFDVPTNSWNPYGSDGPGYYRELPGGGSERLNSDR